MASTAGQLARPRTVTTAWRAETVAPVVRTAVPRSYDVVAPLDEVTSPAYRHEVAVVVLTQANRPAELVRAIASVRAQQGVDLQLVLVLNGTSPQRIDLPTMGPTDRLVVLEENLGIPGGRNVGAAAADARLLLFLDDDAALLGPTVLATAVQRFEADAGLGAMAMRLVDEDGLTQQRHVPRVGARSAARSGHVTHFIGAACAVRADAFYELGGFDRQFFYAMEESDLSWRLLDAGWSIWYSADLTAFHPRTAPSRHPGVRRPHGPEPDVGRPALAAAANLRRLPRDLGGARRAARGAGPPRPRRLPAGVAGAARAAPDALAHGRADDPVGSTAGPVAPRSVERRADLALAAGQPELAQPALADEPPADLRVRLEEADGRGAPVDQEPGLHRVRDGAHQPRQVDRRGLLAPGRGRPGAQVGDRGADEGGGRAAWVVERIEPLEHDVGVELGHPAPEHRARHEQVLAGAADDEADAVEREPRLDRATVVVTATSARAARAALSSGRRIPGATSSSRSSTMRECPASAQRWTIATSRAVWSSRSWTPAHGAERPRTSVVGSGTGSGAGSAAATARTSSSGTALVCTGRSLSRSGSRPGTRSRRITWRTRLASRPWSTPSVGP